MKIRILGAHNIETKNTRFSSLLVDDILALDAGSITSRLPLKAQLKLKAVFLTHRHYDHTRDIPALGMNFYLAGKQEDIYAIRPVYEDFAARLLDGVLYPDYTQIPAGRPTFKINIIEPGKAVTVDRYKVKPVMVQHAVPCSGYQVVAPDGKKLFYTSDTGPGLEETWRQVMPDLLVIELTAANRYHDFSIQAGHLTPELLHRELESFRRLKGYLPRIVTVHANPLNEKEMAAELGLVVSDLKADIQIGREGMLIEI
jgi:ribonuclease BN (tRNA processing enzyme)